jgi:hypothetical protein
MPLYSPKSGWNRQIFTQNLQTFKAESVMLVIVANLLLRGVNEEAMGKRAWSAGQALCVVGTNCIKKKPGR